MYALILKTGTIPKIKLHWDPHLLEILNLGVVYGIPRHQEI